MEPTTVILFYEIKIIRFISTYTTFIVAPNSYYNYRGAVISYCYCILSSNHHKIYLCTIVEKVINLKIFFQHEAFMPYAFNIYSNKSIYFNKR